MAYKPGDVISNRFRILERLGQGAHGVVYRARDLETRGEVALKFLGDGKGLDPELSRRMEREALAMQHPILKDAKDALDKLSADPETLERVERREIELKLHEYGAALLREQGRSEGKRQTLLRLLAIKFGELPPEPVSRIATASEADLELWLERLLSATALDSVFSD